MVEWAKFKPEVSGSLPVRPCLVSLDLAPVVAGAGDLLDAGHSQYQFPLLADRRNTELSTEVLPH